MPELNVVHVDPGGVEVDVDITRAGGASVTAYTTSAGTAPRSLPATISAVTDFWLPEAGDFTFIVSKDDVEVKRETIGVSDREDQPKTLRLTAGDLPLSALASLVGGATGTTVVPTNERAEWARTGALVPSFLLDWEVDQVSSDPNDVIVLDTSPEWADPDEGASGHPAAMVTEAGRYFVRAVLQSTNAPSQAGDFVEAAFRLQIEDIGGAQITQFGGVFQASDSVTFPAVHPAVAVIEREITLPAGAHFELAPANGMTTFASKCGGVTDNDACSLTVAVSRVA